MILSKNCTIAWNIIVSLATVAYFSRKFTVMKRINLTYLIALLAVFLVAAPASAGKLSKKKNKKINSYFVHELQGVPASYDGNEKIEVADIESLRRAVWECWCNAVANFSEDKLIAPHVASEPRDTGYWRLPEDLEPQAVMPYYFIRKGDMPSDGYPLFLYMHGSGNKEREWETGYQLCSMFEDSPSLHFVPQIPNAYGELYRWAIQSKQWAWEKLLRLAFVNGMVDANRVYFFGISEGGYGSQRLASFYADYLAGAGPMAGGEPLKNAPMENLANVAFSLRTGERDYGFARNYMTYNAALTIDSLRKAHPENYKFFIELLPGMGHGIDYSPTTPWLSKFTRNPHPNYFYWEDYDMYGRHRTGFYNLRVNTTSRENDEQRTCYEVQIADNVITMSVNNVEYTTVEEIYGIPMTFTKKYTPATKGNVTLFLNEKLFDLSKPVKVVVNGKVAFNGIVKPTLKAMLESCAEYFDPERVFPASVDVVIE